ncbi:ABC transporter substrate-binding protein [Ramlibacter sp.]|uniref:ABC transporter substrate-binding protein n=1 Tax=Ramlibacter sp. TaxID=1917967 RepID=UPI003D0D7E1D
MKLLSCLAFVAAAAFAGVSPAQAQQTVRVSILPIIDAVPFAVAQKLGYFEQEGLKVDTTPTAGGAVGIPALLGGSVDITFGNVVSTMLAAAQNLPVRVIAPATNMNDSPTVAVLIGRKGEAWNTAANFEGKSIGVNTRNGINWLYARAWVKARGGDPDKVQYREVPFPQLADAIKRKQIDLGFQVEPFKSANLRDPEIAIAGSPFIEVQPGLDVGQYLTTADYLAKNPDTVEKFARAMRKGITWFNDNRANPQLADIVSEFTRIPAATVREIKLQPLPLTVNPDQIRKTVDLMRAHGMLQAPVDVARFVAPVALR